MDSRVFTAKLATLTGKDHESTAHMLHVLVDLLRQRTAELDSVAIPGFGNFVAMKKKERIVFDSATGRRQLLPPKVVVEFVAGTKLKKRVNNE